MFAKIGEFFASLPKELYVFLISILPIIELRGAIPVGAALGVPFYLNYILAVIGNLLPVPFILMFIPIVLDFLGRFKFFAPMVNWLKKKAEKNKGKIIKGEVGDEEVADQAEVAEPTNTVEDDVKKPAISLGIFGALTLFVAIPLPGTGAWTGALVASLFGLPKKMSMLAITIGVLLSGVIMCLASYGILGFLSFLI